jgi:peptidoglycan hydrolase-like protein with peptidoglycan-binding domain
MRERSMGLQSRLFRDDSKLEAAAVSNSANIKVGASGNHVMKIQYALNKLDHAGIDEDGGYGPKTAAAVLAFKKKRNIINRSYQSQADNIVGIMTMKALDDEMVEFEAMKGLITSFGCTIVSGTRNNR